MTITGIGLANIDLIAHVEDSFLSRHGVRRGGVSKFDDLAFARLRADLDNYDAVPGGCAANTLCGLAAMGFDTRFYGKIGADSFESLYRSSFADYGVGYDIDGGAQESSQCAVLVTPDGERSFAYTHGASWDIDLADIDLSELDRATMICTEIYLFEFGQGHALARHVFETAERRAIPLIMKAMDSDFGARYAQKIRVLSDAGVLSLLIGNHQNLPSVAGTVGWQDALEAFREWKRPVLMTANKDGAYYIDGGTVQHFPVDIVQNPLNTIGAGDQFLAGFLAGWADKKSVGECMAFAAAQAKTILMHDTPRPPLPSRRAIRF